MSAQADRCVHCQKRAYPIEKTTYDGKVYHIICLRNKDKAEQKPAVFGVSEEIFCNPQRQVGRKDDSDAIRNECFRCNNQLKAGFCANCKSFG